MKHHNTILFKVLFGIFLLFIVAILLSTFFNEGDYRIDYLGNGILLTLPISLVATIVPRIAWQINHKHLDKKKGITICAVNSLVLFVIAAFLPLKTIIENQPCQPYESLCAIQFSQRLLVLLLFLAPIYFFINLCFFVDFRKTKNGQGDRT